MRPLLFPLLPAGMRSPAPPRRWLASAAAVLAGAVTHVLWDGFTHAGADLVVAIPALAKPVAGAVPVYTFLQRLSTAAGAALITLWGRAWILRHPQSSRRYGAAERSAALRVAAAILAAATAAAC